MNAARIAGLAVLLQLGAAPASAQSELQGSLFTSPEQRAYLDYLRQEFLSRSQERGFDISANTVPEIPAAADSAAPARIHSLSAIVTLRDGTRRIWLNGQALGEHELPDNAVLVQDAGTAALRFGGHLLKPGQTLNLDTGSITESRAYVPPSATEQDAASDSGAAMAAPATAPVPATAIPDDVAAAVRLLNPQQAAELLQALLQHQSGDSDD
jgi:hypothetical protein